MTFTSQELALLRISDRAMDGGGPKRGPLHHNGIVARIQRRSYTHDQVAWAVYLGCTTATLLAKQWGITRLQAKWHLTRAHQHGFILRIIPGRYCCPDPKGPKLTAVTR